MALTDAQCAEFNSFLFRRVPDWDKELSKDRFPISYMYTSMYPSKSWPSFTGTQHTWDRLHVTRPNDNALWETESAEPCIGNPCATKRRFLGWGSTRDKYNKYKNEYSTPVFCIDQINNIEEGVAQIAAIVQGIKKLPDSIFSDFIRQLSVVQANVWHSCGKNLVTVTPKFTADPREYDFGGDAYLPTSKLTMNYLDNHMEDLQYQGYFDEMFTPDGMFLLTSDLQTHREMTVHNPELVRMFNGADFQKGGQFYSYGLAMRSVGNWSFKIDPEPIRAQRVRDGILQRIWPYQNVAATVGKKPEWQTSYKNAQYQMYHVYNKAARDLYTPSIEPVHPEMKTVSRNLAGKWSWKNPVYFKHTDPCSGETCEYNNDKQNMGYFLAEFALASKTIYPEIEMIIWAQREPQGVIDTPRCAAKPSDVYQTDLYPYNCPDCNY